MDIEYPFLYELQSFQYGLSIMNWISIFLRMYFWCKEEDEEVEKHIILFISTAKRCSYNSPTQRSQPIPSNPSIPLIAPERNKGHTEQDQNAGVRLTIPNCDFVDNLFRKKNFCRTMRKFRNCIKNVAKPQH